MIKGLLDAERYLELNTLEKAFTAIDFIHHHLWKNNRLLANYNNHKASPMAFLDDYAFLLEALLTSLQLSWKTDYLHFAIKLANCIMQHHYDLINGGFYYTPDDHEELLYRPKTLMDEAIPSGNGVAVNAFILLGRLIGDMQYLQAAEKTLQLAMPFMMRFPTEHCTLLSALNHFVNPKKIVIIRGNDLIEMDSFKRAISDKNPLVFCIPDAEKNLPGALAQMSGKGHVRAYVCEGTQCLSVVESKEALVKLFA